MAGGSERRAKDAAMAHRLKAEGVKRSSGRCPVCHKVVPVERVAAHLNPSECVPKKMRHGRKAA